MSRTRSNRNVEAVRDGYEALNRRDLDAVLGLLAAEVEWPDVLKGRTLHGHDEVWAYWFGLLRVIDSHVEPEAFRWAGDRVAVVVRQRMWGKQSGRKLTDARLVHVWTFRSGKAIRMRVYQRRPRVQEVAGSGRSRLTAGALENPS
jgi:ketosteroid isomerase-like protein